jgi:NAD(P)-dependent dehydrogenase (short-subunit alcohol dehydrogenase family)
MLQHGYGRIVTVGSRGAVEPARQLAAYCASKAGVVALTKAIADETKGTNITANVVLPSARRQKEGGRRQKVERLIRLSFGSVVNWSLIWAMLH